MFIKMTMWYYQNLEDQRRNVRALIENKDYKFYPFSSLNKVGICDRNWAKDLKRVKIG